MERIRPPPLSLRWRPAWSRPPPPADPVIPILDLQPTPIVELEPIDLRSGGFRYGTPQPVELDFFDLAQWEHLPDGGLVGRLAVRSSGALSMSAVLSRVQLTGLSILTLSNGVDTAYTRNYDRNTRLASSGKIHTSLFPGHMLFLEYRGTLEEKGTSGLTITSVIGGQRDLGDFTGSKRGGDCLLDVACEEGDPWIDQKRSVVLYLDPDTAGCSGFLLNTTAMDFTPYVYVANHCFVSDPALWNFYFNYERPGCGSGVAPMSQFVTGAVQRANDHNGDFQLLELLDEPPASFGAYYAGWDRTNTTPTSGAFIGHPDQGPKKIALTGTTTSGYIPGYETAVWIADILDGGMISGTSGSPFFDQKKRVIGHVAAGDEGCSGERVAKAFKLSGNWMGVENGPSKRLREWLDPINSGWTFLDGMYRELQVKIKMNLQGAYDSGSGIMRADLDSIPYTEPYAALGYDHEGPGGGETADSAVLFSSGNARIVDWVVVELRNATDSTQVFATRSALLRRDGVVAELDGSTDGVLFDVPFSTALWYVAVRHRNHLGTMTAAAVDVLGGVVDFTTTSTALYGTNPTYVTGSTRCLWMGDVLPDGIVKYIGANNDRDPILTRVGGLTTGTYTGYTKEDTNLDNVVKYIGTDNDRDPIIGVTGGTTSTRSAQLP